MKRLIAILFVLCSSHTVHAQKEFRGSITYRLHASTGDKPDAELKVLFGDRKLKLRFKEKEEYDQEELIVVLDSSATYSVNYVQKTFKKKMLKISSPLQISAGRTIAGYNTRAVQMENNGLGALLGKLMGGSNTLFYVADSLYYPVPDRFTDNMEFVMIQKGRIVLGAEIELKNPYYEQPDSTEKNNSLITAEAAEVNAMNVDEAEFLIPADFADKKYSMDPPAMDSVLTTPLPDTVAVPAPPLKKNGQKKPVKPASTKTRATGKAPARKDR